MVEKKPELGQILISKGWVKPVVLEDALRRQAKTREFLGKMLLREGKINEEQLAVALSEQNRVPFKRLKNLYVDWELALRFSTALVLEHRCFPVKVEGTEIIFAVTNMLDAWTRSLIEKEMRGYRPALVLVTERDMRELLARYREYVNMNIRKRLHSDS